MPTSLQHCKEEDEFNIMPKPIYSGPKISDPDGITNRELLDKPLSAISKGLQQSISNRTTMKVYLRWLEVHRKNPSDLAKNWENTVFHWVQSLKARGFKRSEIVDDYRRWKHAHEPFEYVKGRSPIPSEDIKAAYDRKLKTTNSEREDRQDERVRDERPGEDRIRETRIKEEHSYMPRSESYRPESRGNSPAIPTRPKNTLRAHPRGGLDEFDKPPPKNYICNRCSRPGHHLQVCPTNLDPAYDRLPEPDYFCEVCRRVGEHYKSLCPMNQDPFSIIMKRKAKGIKTPPPRPLPRIQDRWVDDTPVRRQDRRYRLTEMENGKGRLSRDSRSPTRPSSASPYSKRERVRQELDMIERTKDDLFSQDAQDFEDLIASSGITRKDSKISKDEGVLKRERPADFDLMDSNMNDETPPQKRTKRVLFSESPEIIENDVEMEGVDKPAAKAFHSHRVSRVSPPVQQPPAPRYSLWSSKINQDEIDVASSEVDTGDEMDLDRPANKPAKIYCEHVQLLMRKIPQMSQEVNKIKKRVTALDMWKNQETQQADLAALVPVSTISPSWSPFAPEDGFEADDLFQATESRKPLFSQFDGPAEDSVAKKSDKMPLQPSMSPQKDMDRWQAMQRANIMKPPSPDKATGLKPHPSPSATHLARPESREPFPDFIKEFSGKSKENISNHAAAQRFQIQRPKENVELSAEQVQQKDDDKKLALDRLKIFSNNFKLTTPVPRDLVSIVSRPAREREERERKKLEEAARLRAVNDWKLCKRGEDVG